MAEICHATTEMWIQTVALALTSDVLSDGLLKPFGPQSLFCNNSTSFIRLQWELNE